MKKLKGQIAIISLFAVSIFVVIGTSIITQIVFEQRKASLEQKSRQAYFAAESGIEQALQDIIQSGQSSLDFSETIGNATVDVSSAPSNSSSTYKVPSPLFSGQTFPLNLRGYSVASQLRVCWNKPDSALIMNYVYTNAGVARNNTFAVNAFGSTKIHGAPAASSGTDSCGITGTGINYHNLTLIGTPQYLVVWAAYADDVQVAFQGMSDDVPAQGTVITSTANVAEDNDTVSREVKYYVSSVGTTDYVYPPDFLQVPVYAVGGVSY